MTGTDLKLSGTRQDFDTSPGDGGQPIVLLSFTDTAARSSRRSPAPRRSAESC